MPSQEVIDKIIADQRALEEELTPKNIIEGSPPPKPPRPSGDIVTEGWTVPDELCEYCVSKLAKVFWIFKPKHGGCVNIDCKNYWESRIPYEGYNESHQFSEKMVSSGYPKPINFSNMFYSLGIFSIGIITGITVTLLLKGF